MLGEITKLQHEAIITAMIEASILTSSVSLIIPSYENGYYVLKCHDSGTKIWVKYKPKDLSVESAETHLNFMPSEAFHDLLAPTDEEASILALEAPEFSKAIKFYLQVIRGDFP